jgi:hypothetical protein
MIVGVAILTRAAYFSGEAIYSQGTAVQIAGTKTTTGDEAAEHDHHGEHHGALREKLEYLAPPLQTHTLMAGMTLAAALGVHVGNVEAMEPAACRSV